jgi:putative ABC transport system permease protein
VRLEDDLRIGVRSLTTQRARAGLTLLAMALGTAAVVLLSALGEGSRRYVVDELAQLGTHLLIVLPGRSETTGGPPPLLGETPRDLTLGDAIAIGGARLVKRFAPIVIGSAPVSFGSLSREVTILGSTSDFLEVRQLELARGRFLPPGDPERGRPTAVLGEALSQELFGRQQALGRWIRIGDRRFRVIGILANEGESLGMDLGDFAVIPVASAQALFDSPALFRILVQAPSRSALPEAKEAIRTIVRGRHEGEDDVTIITQDALLSTFDRILGALTLAVAGIAAISLVVAGILIMNVMLVAISQRTAEIGLLKAVGATRMQVMALFLLESALLSLLGTASGMLLAMAGVMVLQPMFPAFPMTIPWWSPAAAAMTAVSTSTLFGVLPARRAARLDPVSALAEK